MNLRLAELELQARRAAVYPQLVRALRECMSALDMCLNSPDTASALDEADRVLTTYGPLLRRLED